MSLKYTAVREHKRGADDALGHAHAVEEELAVVKNALSRTQATLRSREEEAARTTADVRGWRCRFMAFIQIICLFLRFSLQLNSVTSQLAAAQESLNRLQSDFKQLVRRNRSILFMLYSRFLLLLQVHEKDSLARQLTSTESDLKTVNDRLEASQATRAQLEGKVHLTHCAFAICAFNITDASLYFVAIL